MLNKKNMQNSNPLTLKTLSENTGAPYYAIQHWKECKTLPITKESFASEYLTHYHSVVVEIIKENVIIHLLLGIMILIPIIFTILKIKLALLI